MASLNRVSSRFKRVVRVARRKSACFQGPVLDFARMTTAAAAAAAGHLNFKSANAYFCTGSEPLIGGGEGGRRVLPLRHTALNFKFSRARPVSSVARGPTFQCFCPLMRCHLFRPLPPFASPSTLPPDLHDIYRILFMAAPTTYRN